MSEETISLKKPCLTVNPNHLDFGTFDPNDRKTVPEVELTIGNTGEGLLAGRIIPQTSWLEADPPNFRCAGGNTSSHRIKLLPSTPHDIPNKTYSFDLLLMLSSNGGSTSISGNYRVHPNTQTNQSLPSWVWIAPAGVVAVVILGFILFGIISSLPKTARATEVPAALFTQGAMTVMAQLTPEAVATQPPVVTTATVLPAETAQPAAPEGTFTPFPREAYPNPEEFIRDYYQTINNNDYERAWGMLTRNFQLSCCSVAGNESYLIYVNYWQSITQVEVLSAYLGEYDSNPAIVYVNLRYHTDKGEVVDTANVFYLVADDITKTLLIDEVQ
ncbi:MAG: hypothetical protein HPY76_07790 [Anaerolineae bacterium]|nr:hypothetical protein [Anaerolineae bacterium]